MSAKLRRLNEIIRPVVEGLGYECWGVEFISQGKHSMLRVYIESLQSPEGQDDVESPNASADNTGLESEEPLNEAQKEEVNAIPKREGGIELADCEKVSRQLSGVLDVEDPISNDYTLEVSSPGMDRPLYTLDHYARFSGYQVEMRLRMPFEGRRKFRGILAGIEGNDVVLQVEDEEYLFPVESIEKANIVPQFD